ncbi:HTH-type transcriptional repressor YtrA [Halolactibacillus alkaliphilus]|uniref:HTH-type transcriptional repressor YtrA n=1 Tax=Halolactibacillus alkaliphilus TaxID=442899 RepID=A0A511X3X3_9BACI|nr:GntR family transcriptional regulator [Halolactibacillus alkaliphilus]GEN57648.1 HTH-type transcriptional repressor YtrA [Halolactibacillus alkaliphilus]GGN74516.1 HTH-type transcriptional repressor YtrA [Halolactibacillus alkaliphilus]SFP02105.1 GntR family transcriptional regulator [Halolactibacillus alkaliphilus]
MFDIDLRSRDPIYQQLVDKFKILIINQILQHDEKLPSVRQLAEELTVNPNTIQKAYRQLEQEGFIYSVKGRGSFVQSLEDNVSIEKKKEIAENIKQLAKEALFLGVSKADIVQWIYDVAEEEKGAKTDA